MSNSTKFKALLLAAWTIDGNTRVVEKRYKDLGARITVILKERAGHYPSAPEDAKPVVEFITEATN